LGVTSSSAFVRVSGDPQLLELLDVPAPAGRGPASAEGYLFPATYELQIDSPAYDVLHRLVNESHVRWRRLASKHEAGVTRLAEKLGWGRAEIVTLASMVEKEAAVDEERPLIAGVFLNRLMFAGLQAEAAPIGPDQRVRLPRGARPGAELRLVRRQEDHPCDEPRRAEPLQHVHERRPAAGADREPWRALDRRGPVADGVPLPLLRRQRGGRHKFSETLEEHNKAVHR
jgi:UPF0755 protein